MSKSQQLFEQHYYKAQELAVQEVIRRARLILKHKPNLVEFVMGMGAWFFTMKDGRNTNGGVEYYGETSGYSYTFRPWVKPIADLIGEWDEVLKITGHSVRFTATGPEVTSW